MSTKNLKVIYMINGLIIVGEVIENKPLKARSCIGIIPERNGNVRMMEAFPFSSLSEVIEFQAGSYIAATNLTDEKLEKGYEDALVQTRIQKAGLTMP